MRREVVEALSGLTFRPISKEAATQSFSGASGTVQRFQVRQYDAWQETWQETAVYSSADHGIEIVAPAVWSHYGELGGEGSRLGFPSPVPVSWPSTSPSRVTWPGEYCNFFEGGFIFWRLGAGPFAVSGPIFETIAPDPALREKLGWPVSEERPIGPGNSDRIQFFDNGNVTLRDGKREIWLRPETPRTTS